MLEAEYKLLLLPKNYWFYSGNLQNFSSSVKTIRLFLSFFLPSMRGSQLQQGCPAQQPPGFLAALTTLQHLLSGFAIHFLLYLSGTLQEHALSLHTSGTFFSVIFNSYLSEHIHFSCSFTLT